jgi:hypothetical protein
LCCIMNLTDTDVCVRMCKQQHALLTSYHVRIYLLIMRTWLIHSLVPGSEIQRDTCVPFQHAMYWNRVLPCM